MRRVLALGLVIVAGLTASACGGDTPSAHKALTAATTPTTTVLVATTTTAPAPMTTTTIDPCANTVEPLDQSCGANTPTGQAISVENACAVASMANLLGKAPPPAPPCVDLSAPATTTTVPPPEMPDIVGMTVEDAEAAVENVCGPWECSLDVQGASSDIVTSQNPPAGTAVGDGTIWTSVGAQVTTPEGE